MLGWIIRLAGIAGLLYHGNITAAAVCVLALILASLLDEDNSIRWWIGTAVLVVGLFVLFKLFFWLGVIALVVCAIAILSAKPVSR